MSKMFWPGLVALLISAAALEADESMGQASEPVIGVENWLDGCTQLSKTTVMSVPKMTLDMDCVASALDYCTNNQENSYQDICHEILIEHIRLRSAEISGYLPANPNLKGFKRSSYANARRRTSEDFQTKCEADMSENECLLLDATMKWLNLRLAERLLEGKHQ